MPDLAADLDRIRAHIGCLELAARDESASPLVRAGVVAERAVWELAAELAGHDRMDSNASGAARSATEHPETEAGHDGA